MDQIDKNGEPQPTQSRGPLRGFLKLIVELDSSRLASSRIRSAVVLLALLVAFGLFGYAIPAWLSRYF